MRSLGVFAEMMEKEFFRITRKVLGDGFQWDDAGFSQWWMWFISPVSALTMLNFTGGVLHGCWGMAKASRPQDTSPKS